MVASEHWLNAKFSLDKRYAKNYENFYAYSMYVCMYACSAKF